MSLQINRKIINVSRSLGTFAGPCLTPTLCRLHIGVRRRFGKKNKWRDEKRVV